MDSPLFDLPVQFKNKERLDCSYHSLTRCYNTWRRIDQTFDNERKTVCHMGSASLVEGSEGIFFSFGTHGIFNGCTWNFPFAYQEVLQLCCIACDRDLIFEVVFAGTLFDRCSGGSFIGLCNRIRCQSIF